MSVPARAPRFGDVEDAAGRISGVAVQTPLLESPQLNERVGGRLFVKAECLQRTGSFKFRGAYNRISRLTEAQRRRGVVAFSSGNHAQGVAAAAALLGVPATIVMPSDAPAVKITSTRALGARTVLYDRRNESREEIADDLAAKQGATLVPPFDDPVIVAGQGTCGLEIFKQAQAVGVHLDAVLVPTSGGGLASGIALALEQCSPETKVITVEPVGLDDFARSLRAGRRTHNRGALSPFCDALAVATPGRIPFAILHRRRAAGVTVTDSDAAAAMVTAFAQFRIVTEPSGAVALAAALHGRVRIAGKCVAVVCSGGNVDPGTFSHALGGRACAVDSAPQW